MRPDRWADLSEAGYGVSLLNDCKYGHDVLGNVLRLRCCAAPNRPIPTPTAASTNSLMRCSLMPVTGPRARAGAAAGS